MKNIDRVGLAYAHGDRSWSLARVDSALGLKPPMGRSAVETWYRRIRGKAISDLKSTDLSRAIRQAIHLPLLAPEALRRLQEAREGSPSPKGQRYPGELLLSFGDLAQKNLLELGALWETLLSLVEEERRALDPKALDPFSRIVDRGLEQLEERLATLCAGGLQRGLRFKLHGRMRRVALPRRGALTIGSSPSCTIPLKEAPRTQRGRLASIAVRLISSTKGVCLEGLSHPVMLGGTRFEGSSHLLRPGERFTAGGIIFQLFEEATS